MSATTRKTYQGKQLNELTIEIVKAAEVLLKYKPGSLTIVQGGYNRGGVAASAGTHDGGGALDLTASDYKKKVKVFRQLGCAAWYRPANSQWPPHVHLIVDGDTTASSGAKNQVVQYRNRRNGLANNGADTGYRMEVFPRFVYGAEKQIWEAVRDTHGYSQPTDNPKYKKFGTSRKAGYVWGNENVATVRAESQDWLVTSYGTYYKKIDFKKHVKITKTEDKNLYVVTADPFLWGLESPGSGNRKMDQAKLGTKINAQFSTEVSAGDVWVQSASGFWYSKKYLKIQNSTTESPSSTPKTIEPTKEETKVSTEPERVYVTAKELNVRTSPTTTKKNIVRVLPQGFELTVVSRLTNTEGEWIKTTKGNYIDASFTKVVGSSDPAPEQETPEPEPKPVVENKPTELRPPNTGKSTKMPLPWSNMYHVKSSEWYAAGNSIAGNETAVAKGYKSTDMDSHITKDGVWVLGHDTTPNDDKFIITSEIKAKYGSRPSLEKMLWADVQTLRTPETTYQGKRMSFRYLRVEEVIEWMAVNPKLSVSFEIKQSSQFIDPNTFKALAELCDKHGVDRKRIMIMSIARDYNHLARFKAAHGYFKTAILPHDLKKPSNWSQVEPYVDHYRGSWA